MYSILKSIQWRCFIFALLSIFPIGFRGVLIVDIHVGIIKIFEGI